MSNGPSDRVAVPYFAFCCLSSPGAALEKVPNGPDRTKQVELPDLAVRVFRSAPLLRAIIPAS
jgi:hypothetical protein